MYNDTSIMILDYTFYNLYVYLPTIMIMSPPRIYLSNNNKAKICSDAKTQKMPKKTPKLHI